VWVIGVKAVVILKPVCALNVVEDVVLEGVASMGLAMEILAVVVVPGTI
jgi:hypothetical protein